VATTSTFSATQDTALAVPVISLLGQANSSMTVQQVAPTSANGGKVTFSQAVITYTPPAGSTQQDRFTYTVANQSGATATCTVIVNITAKATAASLTITINPGFNMITTPLISGDNTIAEIMPNVPDGALLYRYDNNAKIYDIDSFELGQWNPATDALMPGDGAFLFNPAPWPFTVTLAGQLPVQVATASPTAGFTTPGTFLIGSRSTQPGKASQVLNQTFADGDMIYQFHPGDGYSIHSFQLGVWDDEPTLKPGEAVFVKLAPR
jgi:hypothetical protein